MDNKMRKPPLPKDLHWNIFDIKADPPIFEEDKLEEFLVHDPLFVEFFNGFLSLPSFPEPIRFNVDTGGFEVVSDDKQQLTRQIKKAVRSQNLMAKMYRVARQHAFSTIPLIPIEESQGPDEVKIDTSYEVTTLNKDQGIYWIRAERLPIFMESDFYFTYRLAKVISQARLLNDQGEFVAMKLDNTPRSKKIITSAEVPSHNTEETIMKQMYISFGDVRDAAKEAWFTQAKEQLQAKTTFTSLAPRVTAEVVDQDLAKILQTPQNSSVFHSHYFGVYSPGLTGGDDSESPVQDHTFPDDSLFSSDRHRPFTPRPSDRIHGSTDMPSSLVKQWPIQDLQNVGAESGVRQMDDRDDKFEKMMNAQPTNDQICNDGSREVAINRNIYPPGDLTGLNVDTFDPCVVAEDVNGEDENISRAHDVEIDAASMETTDTVFTVVPKEPDDINMSDEDQRDSESLLDSAEDFEERDIYSRRNQFKWHSLITLKGIMQFKQFLKGTQGEKYWELWIDVDKGHLVSDDEEKERFTVNLRDRYYRHGADYELSAEDKTKLGLENLSNWVPEYLFLVHAKILEPLALYWAPRYLLMNLIRTEPEKYYMYDLLKSCEPARESDSRPRTQESDSRPRTQALLPLRPKSCYLSTKPGQGLDEFGLECSRPKTNLARRQEADMVTSPMVGYRRIYGVDTIRRLTKTPTAKYLGLRRHQPPKKEERPGESPGQRPLATEQTLCQVKKPKDLLSPMLRIVDSQSAKSRRIASAPVKRTPNKETHENIFDRQHSQDSRKVCDERAAYVWTDGQLPDGDAQFALMRDCDFLGSERMEFLLQALHCEQDAGRSFRKYIEKAANDEWIYSLDFWERVQAYRRLFNKDKLDLFQISKTSKEIFAKFVVEGSTSNVGISDSIELHIMERLKPPFEDLFDEAEEHALKRLFEVFQMYLGQDVKTYCKVERADVVRRLPAENTYILNLQKQGIIKERSLTPEDPVDGYADPVYDESVLDGIPEHFRDWTLENLLHNRLELEYFRLYLAENYAEMDLRCWTEIEAWRRTPYEDSHKRDLRARDINKNYLNKKYFFGPSSPAGKQGQNKVIEVGGGWGKFLENKPASSSILEAQKYVKERLEKKYLPLFMLTRESQARQSPKLSMADSAEYVVVQKKRRSQAVLKLLESKWVSSAKEVFAFQGALLNPITVKLFQSYVAEKGDNLESDLFFWLEVQRYKDMYHTHTEDAMLQQKITAIIHCFIESTIPPSLQIDVPQEMADRILDNKHQKGPYLFRETQLATFRILLTHWQPFCEFRNNMDSYERALTTLERHRLLASNKDQEHKEAAEKRKEREHLLSLGMNDELPNDLSEVVDEKSDKISFSYSDYMGEHWDGRDGRQSKEWMLDLEEMRGEDGCSDIMIKANSSAQTSCRRQKIAVLRT